MSQDTPIRGILIPVQYQAIYKSISYDIQISHEMLEAMALSVSLVLALLHDNFEGARALKALIVPRHDVYHLADEHIVNSLNTGHEKFIAALVQRYATLTDAQEREELSNFIAEIRREQAMAEAENAHKSSL